MRRTRAGTLDALSSARLIANYLSDRVELLPVPEDRGITRHIGAALADSVLQAGLKYETVVSHRVRRIMESFPEAETVSGTIDALSAHGPRHFLAWSHPHKIVRFIALLCHLHEDSVESYDDLYFWLAEERARSSLLTLKGIGPKTVDYLCGLVGLECVAVDRHVRLLCSWVGIEQTNYDELKLAVSYAADFMQMPRRQFDAWLWQIMTRNPNLKRDDQVVPEVARNENMAALP